MPMKGRFAFPKSPASRAPHHQIVYCHNPGHSLWGGGLIPLQSWSRCILQPQPTGWHILVRQIPSRSLLTFHVPILNPYLFACIFSPAAVNSRWLLTNWWLNRLLAWVIFFPQILLSFLVGQCYSREDCSHRHNIADACCCSVNNAAALNEPWVTHV